jgi:low affinity Fe/Cu permease
MSDFVFLLVLMLLGIFLWIASTKFPNASKAGFVMFVVALAAICGGFHPHVPGLMK